MTGATDRHGLEVLPLAQCLSLLRSRPLGRLAYLDEGAPVVVPVNHLVDGSTIVLRSLAGSKLDTAVLNRPVAFQLDDHDPARGTGWSVLVRGTARLVDDAEVISRYTAELDSWAVDQPGEATWMRIDADEVTGRRLRREE
jgi:uncharacterized protein